MATKKYSLKSMQNMWVVFISSRALRVTSPLSFFPALVSLMPSLLAYYVVDMPHLSLLLLITPKNCLVIGSKSSIASSITHGCESP